MNKSIKTNTYTTLVNDIAEIYNRACKTLVESYWQIGRRIVEHEQQGDGKAGYGIWLLEHLSVDLSKKLGGGFSTCNLRNMRRFYLRNRIHQPAGELNWSQHVELPPVTVHTITTNTHDTWSTSSTCLTVRTPKRSMRKAYTSINNFWIRDLHENGSHDIEFGILDLTGPLALHRLRSEPALSIAEGTASVALVIHYCPRFRRDDDTIGYFPASVPLTPNNWNMFPDNETRIVISHYQSNGSCKNKNRKFTMKSLKKHGAACGRSQLFFELRKARKYAKE